MKQRIFGNVVEADGVKKGLITIENGVIAEFLRTTDDALAVHGATNYGDNCLIFPGFIDIHTHCREDVSGKDTHKEDYVTVGRAALSGGVVCVADMPNNPIVPIDEQRYRQKRLIAESRCPIPVMIYAGVNQDSSPFDSEMKPADLEKNHQTDIPYKAFMGPSTNHSGDLNFDDNNKLRKALSRYANKSVSFHCEDPIILEAHHDQPTHETRRPAVAEMNAIDTACEIVKELGIRAKICHVSSKLGLEVLLSHKGDTNVTCEITPHHLYFDVDMITEENRKWLQMNPPIRTREDREYLLQAVRDDKIDYLATDHAPHTKEEKLKGMSGVPQLDTYGPFVAWLIKEQKIDPVTIFNMACKRPGEWIREFWPDRKMGRIEVGYEASVTVLDMTRTAADGRPLYTKCGWSPFDLRNLPGMVQTVWLRGEKVVDELYMK